MDWFFYIDHYVDDSQAPVSEKVAAIEGLLVGLKDPLSNSRFDWVNNANKAYRAVLAELESGGLQTKRILINTRYYFESLLKELEVLEFSEYTNNRCYTIGMYPEVEFCFAYTGHKLASAEYNEAYLIKHAAAYLVALQNDMISSAKERKEKTSGVHLNYRHYFDSDQDMLVSCQRSYESALRAFLALRPRQNGGLMAYWCAANQWVNGSLLWRVVTMRYEGGPSVCRFHDCAVVSAGNDPDRGR